MTWLASSEHVAQPTMTVLVDRLERNGLVDRRPDPTDRRAVLVEITDSGRELLAQLSAARTTVVADALGTLDSADRESLTAALPALERLEEALR